MIEDAVDAILEDGELAARKLLDSVAETDPGAAAIAWSILACYDALVRIEAALTARD